MGFVLDEVAALPPTKTQEYDGQLFQAPVQVVYGSPLEHHPVYDRAIRREFPRVPGRNFNEVLGSGIENHHRTNGDPGSLTELHAYDLFMTHDVLSGPLPISDGDKRASRLVDELLEKLDSKDDSARDWADSELRRLAAAEGRRHRLSLPDGSEFPRFVQFGLPTEDHRGLSRYTFLDARPEYRRAFLSGLALGGQPPYNVCIKTPNDTPSPPFTDITAAHIADVWDITQGKPPSGMGVRAIMSDAVA